MDKTISHFKKNNIAFGCRLCLGNAFKGLVEKNHTKVLKMFKQHDVKRKFIFFILIFIFSLSTTVLNVHAGVIESTKDYANKAKVWWNDENFKEISFKQVYPKAIYKKSYFSWIILGSSIVAGGAFAYFTLGTGAPAAATGVASVASWIGGGGAGSYMAGLSTVGGVVAGNAVTGSVILNGLSYGLIGGTMGKFAALSAFSKFGVIANVSATMIDGVASLNNSETGNPYYVVRFTIPKDTGSKIVRDFVDYYYSYQEKIDEAVAKGDTEEVKSYKVLKEYVINESEKLLKEKLNTDVLSQGDLLVLSMISYENGNIKLFQESVKKLNTYNYKNSQQNGFLEYLNAISYLIDRETEKVFSSLEKAMTQNPYAIESAILYNNLLGDDITKNEKKMLDNINFVEKKFDSDKYAGPYTKLALFFRMGTIYYNNKNYFPAQEFYEKALGEMGIIESYLGGAQLKSQLNLGIANSCYLLGDKKKAEKIFTKLVKNTDKQDMENLRMQYAGITISTN